MRVITGTLMYSSTSFDLNSILNLLQIFYSLKKLQIQLKLLCPPVTLASFLSQIFTVFMCINKQYIILFYVLNLYIMVL